MKSSMPYRGLTSPELRALLRPLLADPALAPASREAWEADVRALWDGAAYREERYAALALTGHRVARPWQDPDAAAASTGTSSRPGPGGTTSTWWPPTGSGRSCCGTGRS